MKMPLRWTEKQLEEQATLSEGLFRTGRLAVTEAWSTHYESSRKKFEKLFQILNDLDPARIDEASFAQVYSEKLGEALRYLTGPPISDDDLKKIADVASLAPTVLSSDKAALRKVHGVIESIIDPHRFPWVGKGRRPTLQQRETAVLASAILLAA